MTILSLYISVDYISGVYFDLDKKQILDKFCLMIPYNPDFHDSVLTTKKLDALITHIEKKRNASKKIITVREPLTDIKADYSVDDLLQSDMKIGLIDYYGTDVVLENVADTNYFQNLKTYKKDLPIITRAKVDFSIIVNTLKYAINDKKSFVLSVLPLSDKSIDEYLEYLFTNIAKLVSSAFIYDIYVDYQFALIPILAVVKNAGFDLDIVNQFNVLSKTGLLAFKDVTTSEVFVNDKKIILEKNKLQSIKLKKGDKLSIDIKYAGGKFKQLYENIDFDLSSFYIFIRINP